MGGRGFLFFKSSDYGPEQQLALGKTIDSLEKIT